MKRACLFLLASVAFGQGQQPNVSNAKFEMRAFFGDLSAQIRSDAPTWFGYAIKTARSHEGSCCWNSGRECGCALEGSEARTTVRGTTGNVPVPLEGLDAMAVLFRVANNTIEKVQAYSLSCQLDAGGLPFIWISGVTAQASLAFLDKLIDADGSHRVTDGALFALSQHEGAEAIDRLIRRAKRDASPHLRGQALFWLAQRAGDRAAATITDAIVNDPDTGVKKRAVFALSQLPDGEGVPKLIDVARTQRNPEVRKQAFFWLGQSKDPRAFAFIESVLTK
ncbi:MAG: HEAT repeat domain-containing protein [Acidobacteriaceae bacterium]|nr:HEAT repeat domain-containing protein [Acidobacteriaceae bacterium]